MKHYIAVGVLIVVGIIVLTGYISNSQPVEPELGGISRTVSYTTSTVATSSATQVLAPNTRSVYRRIQNDTNGDPVHCFAAATSSITSSGQGGIYLDSDFSHVFSSEEGNLWPGAISCIGTTGTSTIFTEEHYQ